MDSLKTIQKDFAAVLIYRVGTTVCYQMMMVAIGWHLFEITNSVLSLGLMGLAELVPFFIFSLFAGHLVDTYSKRGIAMIACVMHLLVGVFLMQVATGMFTPPEIYIYLSVMLLGIGRSLLRPAYNSIFGHVVPRYLTPKYSAYASSAFQVCVVAGPALGGFLIAAIGLAWTYLISGLLALIGMYGIYLVKIKRINVEKNTASFWKSFLEGIHYVKNHRVIMSAMSIDMLAVLFGGAVSMLPAFVKEVLHTGPEALGVLRAAPAIGAILTGFYFANRPLLKHSGKFVILGVVGFGLSMIAFSLTTTLWMSAFFLFLSGCFDSVSVVVRLAIFQLTSPDHMRGRISSINGIFVGSSNELGALESGVAASLLGLAPSIAFGGLVTLLVAIGFYKFAPAFTNLHLQDLMDETLKDEGKPND
jgi:MFS family permease